MTLLGPCRTKLLDAIKSLPQAKDAHDIQVSHVTGILSMCCDHGAGECDLEAAVKKAVEDAGFHYEGCGHAAEDHGHAHSH